MKDREKTPKTEGRVCGQSLKSLQHPIVKQLVKLRLEKEERALHNAVLVMGKNTISELSRHTPLKMLLVEKGYESHFSIKADQTYLVTKEILKKITGIPSPEPIAAVAPLPPSANLSGKKFILGLDAISDPGNLGTLLRTALALNWDGVFILGGGVDPYNDKALRAAKGATFQLPLSFGSREDLKELILKNKLHVYIADMKGTPLEQLSATPPLLLLLGNESHGVQAALKKEFEKISIPMSPKMESLNVSIAGALLMYHLISNS